MKVGKIRSEKYYKNNKRDGNGLPLWKNGPKNTKETIKMVKLRV